MDPARALLVGYHDRSEEKRYIQINFLKKAGLRPSDRLLDVGCGVLRGGAPIIKHLAPAHYIGIERDAKRLAEGRKELAELCLESKAPHLFTDYPALASYRGTLDFIWSFQVFIHMHDEVARTTMQQLAPLLKPTGLFYMTARIGVRKNSKNGWREYPVVQRRLSVYEEWAKSNGLSLQVVDRVSPEMRKALDGAKMLLLRPSGAT